MQFHLWYFFYWHGNQKARSEVKRHSKRPKQLHVWATAPAYLFAKLLLFPALHFDSLLVANCLTKTSNLLWSNLQLNKIYQFRKICKNQPAWHTENNPAAMRAFYGEQAALVALPYAAFREPLRLRCAYVSFA